MTKLFFFTLSVTLLFINADCKKDKPPDIIIPPTPTNCEYPAGNRNFTWRVDTVAWWPSTLGGIHAFSDSDAWVMGSMVSPTGESYVGWHWDGKKWNEKINFLSILMKPNDVTGDENFMVGAGWVGLPQGTTAAVVEFDNKTRQWKGIHLQTKGELRSVWTDGKGYFIAVGDNGMVYTKDGYTAEWVYSKAPTEFWLYDVGGISKDEIYISAAQNLVTGEHYTQGWKIEQGIWKKLFDTKDTSNTILPITADDYPNQMGVWRCNITDSLKLIVHGDQSYLFESRGQELKFKQTNLSDLGLPFRRNGRTGTRVNIFTPNDIWFYGTRYNFYHWNGANFQKMIIPGLPNDDMQFGWQLRPIKTNTGKLFFGSEVSSQIYIIVQGTP
jgi:hypothetical protein